MKLAVLKPSGDLAALVSAYCLCNDPDGIYVDQSICTAPQLGACLCIQLGGEVITDFRDRKPLMSYAGIQSRIRHYRPESRVRSLVIFLTPLGSVRFLPSNGRALYNEGYDIGSMIGDGNVLRLRADASAAPDEPAVARAADAWLRFLFEQRRETMEFRRLAEAMRRVTECGISVSAVAQELDLSERQLERDFRDHLGLSPKQYQQLHRVIRSLQAVISGLGDPFEGFADQAHQIRNWQTYLGVTPGTFRRNGPSPLGEMFQRQVKDRADEWPHYI